MESATYRCACTCRCNLQTTRSSRLFDLVPPELRLECCNMVVYPRQVYSQHRTRASQGLKKRCMAGSCIRQGTIAPKAGIHGTQAENRREQLRGSATPERSGQPKASALPTQSSNLSLIKDQWCSIRTIDGACPHTPNCCSSCAPQHTWSLPLLAPLYM